MERADAMVVRSSVRVALPAREAFRLFTEQMAAWWPLATHSVHGSDSAGVELVAGEGGRIVETSAAGDTTEWGTVTAWDPPHRLAFTWHPGEEEAMATRVEITFVAEGEASTRVDLVHTGFEVRGERAAAAVESYGPGWAFVLGRLVTAAEGAG